MISIVVYLAVETSLGSVSILKSVTLLLHEQGEKKVVFIFECHLQETLSHFPASSNPIAAVHDCMLFAVNFHLSTHIA